MWTCMCMCMHSMNRELSLDCKLRKAPPQSEAVCSTQAQLCQPPVGPALHSSHMAHQANRQQAWRVVGDTVNSSKTNPVEHGAQEGLRHSRNQSKLLSNDALKRSS